MRFRISRRRGRCRKTSATRSYPPLRRHSGQTRRRTRRPRTRPRHLRRPACSRRIAQQWTVCLLDCESLAVALATTGHLHVAATILAALANQEMGYLRTLPDRQAALDLVEKALTNAELERCTERGRHMDPEALVAYARAEVADVRAEKSYTRRQQLVDRNQRIAADSGTPNGLVLPRAERAPENPASRSRT